MTAPPDKIQNIHIPFVSKFKGVISQPNNLWSAKIILNHQLIFLGTFTSEIAAARAHDSASLKFHRYGFFRNFLLTDATVYEPYFQDHFSDRAILDMIRDGSYEPKLVEFVHMSYDVIKSIYFPDDNDCLNGVFVEELFHVELGSCDVTIPGRFLLDNEKALKYFPHFVSTENRMVQFHDRDENIWTFQYCYSNSAQRYMFGIGWDSFVKEMRLQVNDIVVFYRCREWINFRRESKELIDCIYGFRSICDVRDDVDTKTEISSA